MNVYQKLNLARQKFHSLKIAKTGENKFAGYKYFELGDFIAPALQIMDEVGLCPVIRYGKETATLTMTNVDKDESIVFESPMSEANLKGLHAVQNLGAVQTYLRRYLWVAALEIVEHDALDATTGRKGDAPIVTPKGGIGDDLPDDVKQSLADMALYCTELVTEGKPREAYEFIKSQNLEPDQETWLASQMDSKTRASIKASKTIAR